MVGGHTVYKRQAILFNYKKLNMVHVGIEHPKTHQTSRINTTSSVQHSLLHATLAFSENDLSTMNSQQNPTFCTPT